MKLTKQAYRQLIDEYCSDIQDHMNSVIGEVETGHICAILQASVNHEYPYSGIPEYTSMSNQYISGRGQAYSVEIPPSEELPKVGEKVKIDGAFFKLKDVEIFGWSATNRSPNVGLLVSEVSQ